MRFSIGALLLLMIASAMSMLAWKQHQDAEMERGKILDLEKLMASRQDEYLLAKHRLELYRQVLAGGDGSGIGDEARDRFESLQRRRADLSKIDGSVAAIVSVSVPISSSGDLVAKYRVQTPKGREVRLVGSVIGGAPAISDVKEMKMVLPEGESWVTIRTRPEDGRLIAQMEVADQTPKQMQFVIGAQRTNYKSTKFSKPQRLFESQQVIRLVSFLVLDPNGQHAASIQFELETESNWEIQ